MFYKTTLLPLPHDLGCDNERVMLIELKHFLKWLVMTHVSIRITIFYFSVSSYTNWTIYTHTYAHSRTLIE